MFGVREPGDRQAACRERRSPVGRDAGQAGQDQAVGASQQDGDFVLEDGDIDL
jgi:hypothetical protein